MEQEKKEEQNGFKKTIIKYSIIIAFISACIGVAYYFLISLPEKQDLENSTACQSKASDLYNEEMGRNSLFLNNTLHVVILEPKFQFVKDMNTCLYTGGYVNASTNEISEFIKDAQTNEIVAEYKTTIQKGIEFSSDEQRSFKEKQKELFF
ncbi:MAG: hypothetical protein WC795_02395 [Candidatus Paceibacterota bacterium]|jgi:hypothetical protein